jgi:UDP-3-O-[3-hydroxymyristoyl] glucosamine N-acyltransferase
MSMTLGEIAERAGARLIGDAARPINAVNTLQDAQPGEVAFLANVRYRKHLKGTRASAVVLGPADVEDCPVDSLVAENPYLAHARVLAALYPDAPASPGVHATAVVDDSADLDPTAEIGPNACIGRRVRVGARAVIGPNCVLLDDVVVGEDARLVAMVTLGPRTRIGRRSLVHPGTVIGGDGFGLARDGDRWVKVAQIGAAVIGDDVEIGCCCSIDRGAIGDTEIADGVKIDNQVHVAHNVTIGRHTAIAGCTGIAGSAHVGASCMIAGAVNINGHVDIADGVQLSGTTTVTRSIRQPGVYTSTVPALPHADWLKNFARLRQLDDIVRKMRALEGEVAALRARLGDEP